MPLLSGRERDGVITIVDGNASDHDPFEKDILKKSRLAISFKFERRQKIWIMKLYINKKVQLARSGRGVRETDTHFLVYRKL